MKNRLAFGFVIISIILIGYHLTQLWLSTKTIFHQDEFQHVHIAWNILNGKLPYRNFFETHGPLSSAFFSFLLKLAPEPTASVKSIFFLRNFCLLGAYINLLLLFFCLRHINKELSPILLTLVIFVGGLTMQVNGFKIRPDIFVQSFFILSLICWFKHYRFFSGVCLGICLGFNPKFLPLNIAMVCTDFIHTKFSSHFGLQFDQTNPNHSKPTWFRLIGGEVLIWIFILIGLAYTDALMPALKTMFVTNIEISIMRHQDAYWHFKLFRSAIEYERQLLIVSFLCLLGLTWLIFKTKRFPDSNTLTILILALTSFIFLTAPIVQHSVLLISPIFSLLILHVASKIFKTQNGLSWSLLALGSAVSYFTYIKLPSYNKVISPDFSGLEKILTETKRDEPMFYYWPSNCPAYVFNADQNKYWINNEFRTEKMKQGQYDNRLDNPEVKWVAIGYNIFHHLHTDERNYLEKNFKQFNCVWKRR